MMGKDSQAFGVSCRLLLTDIELVKYYGVAVISLLPRPEYEVMTSEH